VNDVSFSGS